MGSEKTNSYSKEFQDEILKECFETNNYGAVARKHGIPSTTIYGWIKRYKNRHKIQNKKTIKGLEKELADAKLENLILKELLKKSHQLWLKD